MDKNEAIGIFDSGIGGVTVLKEILKVLPNENYIYYSDSKNNPYGDKNDKQINEMCENIVKLFIKKNCKAIVIACNTASAKSVQYLRQMYKNIPFIAIEPAYKMVYDYAYNEQTLVMATKGTIESEKFNLLYNKYNNHKTILLPCVGLADVIEEGNKNKIKEYLNQLLEKYKGKVKNVVLGCTHYPLAQKEIQDILGQVKFFNGAPYLAKHLKNVLEEKDLINTNCPESIIQFIDSSNDEQKEKRFFEILKRENLR